MSFVDTHAYANAFIGNLIGRLYDQIVEQGDDFLEQSGLSFPSRATSTMLMLAEHENVSMADITRMLQQPHQLVAQRLDLLIELGLVLRKPDPLDGRRKILTLTRKGERQATVLHSCLEAASKGFSDLFEKSDVDLPAVVQEIITALNEKSITERAHEFQPDVNTR